MSTTLLRLPAVSSKTGLSRSTIYERIKAGRFPQPISLGDRAIGFVSTEVDDWITERISATRRGIDGRFTHDKG